MTNFERFKFNDGGSVPTVAFGTGTTFFNRNAEVTDCILKAVKIGYRLIDTAEMYGTQEGVGMGIKNVLDKGLVKREDLFVNTKLPPFDQTEDETIAMVDDCLQKLQLSYVDSLLIHFPGLPVEFDPMKTDKADPEYYAKCITSKKPERAPEARMIMWQALQKCVKAGKIKHIGVSNFSRSHIEQMVKDPRCTIKPVMNQIEFNPYCCDNDILAVCKENGIVVQAFAPIGSGARPGRGKALGETQLVLDDPVLKGIAERLGCSLGQVCIGWALRKGVAVATKTEKESRMVENLESIQVAPKLTDEDIKKIDALNMDLKKYWNPYAIA